MTIQADLKIGNAIMNSWAEELYKLDDTRSKYCTCKEPNIEGEADYGYYCTKCNKNVEMPSAEELFDTDTVDEFGTALLINKQK
jgi:hypothetical protein